MSHEPKSVIVSSYLESGDINGLRRDLEKLHPADVAEILKNLEEPDRFRVFRLLPAELASEILTELDEEMQEQLIHRSDEKTIGAIFEEMATDDAVDIIGDLPEEDAEKVLSSFEKEEVEELKELLQYDEESAGGIMTPEILFIDQDRTVDEAIVEVREKAKEFEEVYTVFVVDEKRRLKGSISLHNLILADITARVYEIMEQDVIHVTSEVDREEVARIMVKYNLVVIPVVDSRRELIGRITFDDVMDIIEDETTEDILLFAGVDEEEEITGGPKQAVRSRLPWLYINLFSAFVAASVINLFSEIISKKVVLAVFMPLVAGMAGSSATQTLAVTVRSIALGEINAGKAFRLIRKEILIGMLNGIGLAVVVTIISVIWQQKLSFGLMIGLVVWLMTTVATTLGALIPLTLKKIGYDPAIASTSFVTTLTDIISFVVLLGLGTLFLVYI